MLNKPTLYDHLTGKQNLILTARMFDNVPDGRIDQLLDLLYQRGIQISSIVKEGSENSEVQSRKNFSNSHKMN